MKLKVNPQSIIISAVVGGVVGFLGGPVFVLVPWTIIGVVIGIFNETKKSSIINGAFYGFTIAYSFMLSGYKGSSSITTRLLPFIIIGIVGAICGLTLALIGFLIAKRKTKAV